MNREVTKLIQVVHHIKTKEEIILNHFVKLEKALATKQLLQYLK